MSESTSTQTIANAATTTASSPLKLEGIVPTRNARVFQLILRSENEKPALSGGEDNFSIFMNSFSQANVEKRVKYQSVDVNFLEAYGLATVDGDGDVTLTAGSVTGELLGGAEDFTAMKRVKDVKNGKGDSIYPAAMAPCKLVVIETFAQRISKDSNGMVTWSQSPKINPSNKEVLCNQGKPIYRNVELAFDINKEDVYIKHDGTSQAGEDPFVNGTPDGLMG